MYTVIYSRISYMINYILQVDALYGSIKHTSFPQISVTHVPLQPPCMFANVDHTYSFTSLQ